MERPVPRTLLERLIQESDRTLEETCEDFERCARETNERGATLSVRQLGRWMAGQVDNARPASRRVARHLWGRSFKELLGPPEVSTKVVSSEGDSALARAGAEDHSDRMAPARGDSALAVAADESARFVTWAEAENVGELTLEQLHAEIRRISHAYLKLPTGRCSSVPENSGTERFACWRADSAQAGLVTSIRLRAGRSPYLPGCL